jgi:predicted dinucleotide-binding enzyme
MKKIGILGSGQVAKTLGKGFLKHGFSVMLGSRSPEKLADWQGDAPGEALTGNFAEAAAYGEIIVLAVKGHAAQDAIRLAGSDALNGKTIIDTTNPIGERGPVEGVLSFFTTLDSSLMERLQDTFPEANFVKCFNSVGSPAMVNPHYEAGRPSMFICGNSNEAKAEVRDILDLFGWEIEDLGTAVSARAIEPLCILWCIPGFRNNSWNHAFKLLKA